MGRFRIQLLFEDNTWSTQYNIPENDQFSDTSTDRTSQKLDFTKKNNGIKLTYDQIDTPNADMCFGNITITHSLRSNTHTYIYVCPNIMINTYEYAFV